MSGKGEMMMDLSIKEISIENEKINREKFFWVGFCPEIQRYLLCVHISWVEKVFFNHGFDCSSFRIRMLFPSALMPYRSSKWIWNPSSRTVSAIPKAAFANRSSPARFPVSSNSFPSAWVVKERWASGSTGRMGSCSSFSWMVSVLGFAKIVIVCVLWKY